MSPDPTSSVEVVLKADVKRTELLKECQELEEKSNTEVYIHHTRKISRPVVILP